MYRSRRGGGSDSSASSSASHGVPGKRTLTSSLPARVQRKPAADATPEAAVASLIVAGGAALQPGQQTREQFLAALHEAVVATAGDAFGPLWSALACPSIDSWFGRNAHADPAALERLLQRYTGIQSARSATDYIAPACARLRAAIARQQAGGDVSADLAATGMPATPEAAAAQTLPQGDGAAAGAVPAVQKKAKPGDDRDAGESPAQVAAALGPGTALDGGVASRMGGAFGESFSDVRVHTDDVGAAQASQQGALAFTVGNHIAFGAGRYTPGTVEGDALLAHELAHVVQQRGADPASEPVRRKAGDDASTAHEEDADQAAASVVKQLHGNGREVERGADRAGVSLRSNLSLQRCSPEQNKKEAAKLPKLLTDFTAQYPGTEDLIVKDKSATKLVDEAAAAGVEYGGHAEDGPGKQAWPYTNGNKVYVPKGRDKFQAISDFLFELNNAIRKPKFAVLDDEARKGSKGSLTPEEFARKNVELEVEGMLRMGEVWFEMKKGLGDGKELDKYDADFFLSSYKAFKDGKMTKEQIVESVLNSQSGFAKGKTTKQFYIDQYKDLSGGK